jgi:regulator of protease activity HflC (stomatin/prohibitin superfamily)
MQQTGPSAEDLLTLTAWRAEQARIHEHGMARQRQVRQAEEDRSTQVQEHERINAAFSSLAPADQALTLQGFQNHIASVNPMVFSLMKKQGLKSPVVQAAFTDFLRTALNLTLETTAA